MKMSWTKWLGTSAAGAVVGLAAQLAAGQSNVVPVAPARTVTAPPQVVEVVGEANEGGDFLIRVAEAAKEGAAEELPKSDYWIGIALGDVPEVARQQLGVEQGLLVIEVMNDSPAAKAEFKVNDILLRAGDAKLGAPADLIKAVDAGKEKELAIVLLRGGKERTLKITPIKRPKEDSEARHFEIRLPGGEIKADVKADIKKLEEALAQLKIKAGSGPLGIMLARPGVVPPPAHVDVLKLAELPKGMKIAVIKEGNEPTKLHVERDGKTWDVTEDKLDDLPEDLRPHVQQMLGRRVAIMRAATGAGAAPGGRIEFRLAPTTAATPAAPVPPAAPAPPTALIPTAPRRTATAPYPAPPAPVYTPVTPYTPGTPVTPPQVARLHTYRVETAGGGVESKLDAILKKLDQLESKSVEQLEKEVKQLRKELDELRGKSPGERRDRD